MEESLPARRTATYLSTSVTRSELEARVLKRWGRGKYTVYPITLLIYKRGGCARVFVSIMAPCVWVFPEIERCNPPKQRAKLEVPFSASEGRPALTGSASVSTDYGNRPQSAILSW